MRSESLWGDLGSIETPTCSPMGYPFSTKPYAHQLKGLIESWEQQSYALFWEMGTGKTWVAINTAALLYAAGEVKALAVVAPKGVYRNWVGEIEQHLPASVECWIGVWSPERTKKKTWELAELFNRGYGRLQILLMNIEALSTQRGADFLEQFLKVYSQSLLVIDESTSIKTPKASRTKAILRLAGLARYRRIMTGSPITQSPIDLYTQCAVLDPDLLGFKSFYAFRARYAVLKTEWFYGRKIHTIVGYQRLDELASKLETFSSRVLKADCLDLPEKIYERREVELSVEQKRAYKAITEDAKAKLSEGEVTVLQAITQILRLHQVACGFVKTDDGLKRNLPSGRLGALFDLLQEIDGKAIIWATYRHNIGQIANALRDQYGGESVAVYYGDTTADDRMVALERFQNDSDCRWFVGNPQTGGYGLTLTAASTVIYFSNSYKLEERIQSEDRAHRIGQRNNVTYIDLFTPGTVDERIVDALRAKKQIAAAVMREKWREWI